MTADRMTLAITIFATCLTPPHILLPGAGVSYWPSPPEVVAGMEGFPLFLPLLVSVSYGLPLVHCKRLSASSRIVPSVQNVILIESA